MAERCCMGRKMIHHSPPKHPEQADPAVQTPRQIDVQGAQIDDAMRYWLKQMEKKGQIGPKK